jgi:hypothetical protein
MKRNILTIIMMTITLLSCRGKEKMGFSDRDGLNKDMGDKIVKNINRKDTEALYDLFSADSKKNVKDFKLDIKKLFSFCDGKIIHYEYQTSFMKTSIEKGKNSTEYHTVYNLVTDKQHYELDYIYIVKNDFDVDSIGIRSLKIVTIENERKYRCFFEDFKDGIIIPEMMQ